MLLFLYLTAIFALVAADGYYYETPNTRTPLVWSILPPAQRYQYHTQDSYGQYSYGYGEPLSKKQEVRTLDGITRGSYTYVDPNGKLQTVAYTADSNGFRVAATNLPSKQFATSYASAPLETPSAVVETPEVAAARLQHMAAHAQARLRSRKISTPATQFALLKPQLEKPSDKNEKDFALADILPQPVEDTPEVAAAKAEFFKSYEQVKQRNESLRQKKNLNENYELARSQPTTVTVPLADYKSTNIPSNLLRYAVYKFSS